MMSLVAYDSGSDNEEDEEEETNKLNVSSVSVNKNNDNVSLSTKSSGLEGLGGSSSTSSSSSSSLRFDSVLPKPKYSSLLIENDPIPPKKLYGDEETMPKPPEPKGPFGSMFGKKGNGPVRITIPSLKDLGPDDDDEKQRSMKFNNPKKGSGLFAILPEPKLSNFGLKPQSTPENSSFIKTQGNSTKNSLTTTTTVTTTTSKSSSVSLVPQQMLKRPLSPTSANKKLAAVRAKYMKQEVDIKIVSSKTKDKANVALAKKNDNDDEDSDEMEEATSTDFFSFSSTDADDVDVQMETIRVPSPVFFSSERMDTTEIPEEEEDPRLPSASFTNPSSSNGRIDDDIMKYIQPDRKKARKGGPDIPMNIIDVSADDLRPASTEWLKAISDTSMMPPRKVNLPGGLSKRKHQITYLAAEAKAREEELQNQWASNRHARRQTQSKYGF